MDGYPAYAELIVARQRLGQHFLVDGEYIERMITAMSPMGDLPVVEIGPGQGALSKALIPEVKQLTAVELDLKWWDYCRHHFQEPHIEWRHGDILDTELSTIAPRVRIAGNIPYQISSPLITWATRQIGHIIDMHWLIQHEFAQRLAAPVGSSHYGALTVMCQYHFQVEYLYQVPADAFSPPPKVLSAVVRLQPRQDKEPLADESVLDRIVHDAFSMRRKMLRNALAPWLSIDEMAQLAIDPCARPQEVTVADYVRISNWVKHGGYHE